jgi:hypothetical protein
MTATNIDAAERIRRSEYVRDSRAALARGETLQDRSKRREESANRWAAWLRQRMDASDCDGPVQILPDALARLQQIAEDSAVAAIKEFKTAMKGVLK